MTTREAIASKKSGSQQKDHMGLLNFITFYNINIRMNIFYLNFAYSVGPGA